MKFFKFVFYCSCLNWGRVSCGQSMNIVVFARVPSNTIRKNLENIVAEHIFMCLQSNSSLQNDIVNYVLDHCSCLGIVFPEVSEYEYFSRSTSSQSDTSLFTESFSSADNLVTVMGEVISARVALSRVFSPVDVNLPDEITVYDLPRAVGRVTVGDMGVDCNNREILDLRRFSKTLSHLYDMEVLRRCGLESFYVICKEYDKKEYASFWYQAKKYGKIYLPKYGVVARWKYVWEFLFDLSLCLACVPMFIVIYYGFKGLKPC